MITSSTQKRIIRSTAAYLVENIMNWRQCSRDEAVEILMETTVYETLSDVETELYLESRESVLNRLQEEFAGNTESLMAI